MLSEKNQISSLGFGRSLSAAAIGNQNATSLKINTLRISAWDECTFLFYHFLLSAWELWLLAKYRLKIWKKEKYLSIINIWFLISNANQINITCKDFESNYGKYYWSVESPIEFLYLSWCKTKRPGRWSRRKGIATHLIIDPLSKLTIYVLQLGRHSLEIGIILSFVFEMSVSFL